MTKRLQWMAAAVAAAVAALTATWIANRGSEEHARITALSRVASSSQEPARPDVPLVAPPAEPAASKAVVETQRAVASTEAPRTREAAQSLPPDVPPLNEEAVGTVASLRKQMETHRSNKVCASCHARMDPLGFALENYDALPCSATTPEENLTLVPPRCHDSFSKTSTEERYGFTAFQN